MMTPNDNGLDRLATALDQCDRVLAQDRLWRIFSAQAEELKRERANRRSCHIGIRDFAASRSVFFRVGRELAAETKVVALTVSPQIEWNRIVFRMDTVTVVNG